MLGYLKGLARDSAAQLLYGAGVTRPMRYGRGKLTAVTFHRVLPASQIEEYVIPTLAVTPEELRWFLTMFAENFECGTLDAAAQRLRSGTSTRPLLAITFDDGQVDNFLHAKPVLDEVGVKASFFIPTAGIEEESPLWHDDLGHHAWHLSVREPERARLFFDELGVAFAGTREAATALVEGAKGLGPAERGRFCARVVDAAGGKATPEWDGRMSWEQLGTLVEEGHEVGSHSVSHELLSRCDDSSLTREVVESRRVLQSKLGCEIRSFCYPNGDTDARVARAVRDAGYSQAVTTKWGRNPRSESPWSLRRCDIASTQSRNRRGSLSEERVAWRMSGLYPGLG